MSLSQQAIDELKQIMFEDYGTVLSDGEAMNMAIRLLEGYKAVYRPIPEDYDPNVSRFYKAKED
jgi:hypothetical protein